MMKLKGKDMKNPSHTMIMALSLILGITLTYTVLCIKELPPHQTNLTDIQGHTIPMPQSGIFYYWKIKNDVFHKLYLFNQIATKYPEHDFYAICIGKRNDIISARGLTSFRLLFTEDAITPHIIIVKNGILQKSLPPQMERLKRILQTKGEK
jgi:hypothetical protein